MSDFAYDAVQYSNYPYAQTHPDRLATVAIMHGVEPPDPFHARVLELGCGAGGNLLAMATATPGIQAVGVDLAESAIAEAREAAAGVGLANIEFRREDVRSLTDGRLGTFDYIVAHGIYGWMPPEANDALLATINASLAPNGIAYVSFNAQPGGYFRRLLRDVALRHARGIDDLTAKATKAREVFEFLMEHRVTTADAYGAILAREVPSLAHAPIYRLVHDDLGEHWYPTWFGDFADHAAEHGLEYVGEADLYSLRVEMLTEEAERAAWDLAAGDRVAFENLSDLLTGRHFRQSVLARAGAGAVPEPDPATAARLHWAVRPQATPEADGSVHARVHEVLDRRRPLAVGFDDLRATLDLDAHTLAEALLEGFRREHLVPHAGPLRVAEEPGERPRISPLARWQAARGEPLTTLVYTTVHMEEPAARELITLLDGTRDRDAIRADLLQRTGLELTPEDLEANLHELARIFLMEPPS
jgi:SAM-dependent methyltransferase